MVGKRPKCTILDIDGALSLGKFPSVNDVRSVTQGEEHSFSEMIDVMRSHYQDFATDARELWRRFVFNHLITNVDDHLQNYFHCSKASLR
jgi:serine/threonine protein kinase HipA of HipAB toxin-antitoxin module